MHLCYSLTGIIVIAFTLGACSPHLDSESKEPDTTESEEATPVDTEQDGSIPDTSKPEAAGLSWNDLKSYLTQQVTNSTITGYALKVYDANDKEIFHSEEGSFLHKGNSTPATAQARVKIASATKWITATTALAVLENDTEGEFATLNLQEKLDYPLVPLLECSDLPEESPFQAVTARQLLSFTSGLLPEHPCVGDSPKTEAELKTKTLEVCACKILEASHANLKTAVDVNDDPKTVAHLPGKTLKYGSAHHVIIGAAVEKRTGKSWNENFQDLVARKLNNTEWLYGGDIQNTNPNLAGGFSSTLDEYAKFVSAHFHEGKYNNQNIISKEAVEEQQKSQLADDTVHLLTPTQGLPLTYGLNNWQTCLNAPSYQELKEKGQESWTLEDLKHDEDCDDIFHVGHNGKGGYTPWIDKINNYYAVLVIREEGEGSATDYKVTYQEVANSVKLMVSEIMAESLSW